MKRKEVAVLRSQTKTETKRQKKNLIAQPKPSTKKIPTISVNKKKAIVLDSKRFFYEDCRKKWDIISKQGVIEERIIDEPTFDQYGLTDLLNDKGLIKSITFGKHYNPTLV